MKYKKLGKLPEQTVNFFLNEIIKQKQPDIHYQWIHFNDYLYTEFLKIFVNTELKIQWDKNKNVPIQKVFCSDPGYGFKIHKDGLQCRSALNIVLSCNNTDWVRWYDEDYINSISTIDIKHKSVKFNSSRDTTINNYEAVPYIEELRNEIGDVYVLDVDTFHSFKCIGNNPRIVLQTKFDGFPNFETVNKSLQASSFSNIINYN